MILHSLPGEEEQNLGKNRVLASYVRIIPINLLLLILLLPDQLVSSYELSFVLKYFHSTVFSSKFCILQCVGLDINKDKKILCGEV